MNQLTDIPYSVLKEDKRAYEIMLLYDQHGDTFADIAKACCLSVSRTKEIYHIQKIRQIRLYSNHIAVALGDEDISQVKFVYEAAYDCYQDWICVCAYLEKKYEDILTEYRAGEPGMPKRFIQDMPPFKSKLRKKEIARVVEMWEVEKASFVSIARALHLTQAKARQTYESFYHKQALALLYDLEKKAQSKEEKDAIWDDFFRGSLSSKKTLR